MSKAIKIVIVIAVALILAGVVLTLVAFAVTGFDAGKLGAGNFDTTEYAPEGEITRVEINVRTADVTFLVASDGVARVECYESEKQPHTVALEDGKLSVSAQDERKWYEKITVFSKSPKVKIWLPAGEYDALALETDTGDVAVPEGLSFREVSIETDTGDVKIAGIFATSLKIKTDTGDVEIPSLSTGDVGIRTNTGKAIVNDATTTDFAVETDTGKVKLTGVNCAALTIETDTGDVILKNVIGTGNAKIETDTGDVQLDRCDAQNYKITTDTGDVTGTVLSEKIFFTSTRTGDIDVPHTKTGGEFDVKTATGDIEITIAE